MGTPAELLAPWHTTSPGLPWLGPIPWAWCPLASHTAVGLGRGRGPLPRCWACATIRDASPAQVISGGHYDVDCYVEDPNGKTIYQETKKQYDSFSHHTEAKGVYTFCFSNEFSTFSHKIVYFDFQVGDEPPILPDMNNRVTALTQLESACVTIHEMLKAVIDSQTHYRLREAQDRSRAEELNGRVSYWSVGETLILFVVSIGQVVLLKSFFTEKRPSSSGAGT
uniref:GOLD domain-containing protein n=1 Tax=Zonotrichia albicollis TaxID=44394 RepID=A0A8D2MTK0_ZONAL|nr:transmembrane emp24 domain-containing protein 3 [Zonotrichia albicollis]